MQNQDETIYRHSTLHPGKQQQTDICIRERQKKIHKNLDKKHEERKKQHH